MSCALVGSPKDYLFANGAGHSYDPDDLRKRVLYPAMDKAGIQRKVARSYGFHLFRHSAGSQMQEVTGDLKQTQGSLGHSRRTGGKGFGRTARLYVPEESHSGILPMNHSESGSGTVARRHSAPAATISHCFGAARYGAKKWPRSQGCVLEQYEFV